MPNTELDDKRALEVTFRQAAFVVRATDTERFFLWSEWSDESLSNCEPHRERFHIKPHRTILRSEVGKLGENMPVYVELTWWLINNVRVLFYAPCGRYSDHQMIENWMMLRCRPKWDGNTRLAYTDAMNFYHVIQAVRERTGRA